VFTAKDIQENIIKIDIKESYGKKAATLSIQEYALESGVITPKSN
jgi:hypothetical protein